VSVSDGRRKCVMMKQKHNAVGSEKYYIRAVFMIYVLDGKSLENFLIF
jgi:hypothetical protein